MFSKILDWFHEKVSFYQQSDLLVNGANVSLCTCIRVGVAFDSQWTTKSGASHLFSLILNYPPTTHTSNAAINRS